MRIEREMVVIQGVFINNSNSEWYTVLQTWGEEDVIILTYVLAS